MDRWFVRIVLLVFLAFQLDGWATDNHIRNILVVQNNQIEQLYYKQFPERKPIDDDY